MSRPVRVLLVALAAALLLSASDPAAAEDGWRFRRTTPRAALLLEADGYEIGVPGGRAWGIESGLRALTGTSWVAFEVAVDDPAVREAFLRVAYYDRETGRPRQMEIADSAFVRVGEDRVVSVTLEPPTGAVAYRVRVLARLSPGARASALDAIRVGGADAPGTRGPRPYTRLRPDGP